MSTLADDQNISTIGEKAKTIQGRVTSTNIEQILAYQPDLILVPDYNLNTVKALRSLGLKVYVCKILQMFLKFFFNARNKHCC